jgi:hypothetical protein
MSEAEFTPGPWEAVDSLTVRGPFAFRDSNKPGVQICSLTHYVPATERAANARLIAAAPQLLEACKAQHRAIDMLMARLIQIDPGFMPTKAPSWEAVKLGHAAISKATGSAS